VFLHYSGSRDEVIRKVGAAQLQAAEAAARALGLTVSRSAVEREGDFENAFASAKRARAQADELPGVNVPVGVIDRWATAAMPPLVGPSSWRSAMRGLQVLEFQSPGIGPTTLRISFGPPPLLTGVSASRKDLAAEADLRLRFDILTKTKTQY
jgi:hypothetical protein